MIHYSVVKRHRQSLARKSRNNVLKGKARHHLAQIRKEIEKGNQKVIHTLLSQYYSLIDKAAKRRALHPRTAARYKSRISIALNNHITHASVKKPASKSRSPKQSPSSDTTAEVSTHSEKRAGTPATASHNTTSNKDKKVPRRSHGSRK